MEYNEARYRIAQQQLRAWKKNRGTGQDCRIHADKPKTQDSICDARVEQKRDNRKQELTLTARLLKNYF